MFIKMRCKGVKMDNTDIEGVEQFEPKPGFALVKYGNIFTFNFNQEFAQRLNNILIDFQKNHGLQEPMLRFYKILAYGEDGDDADLFDVTRFHHVYTVSCEREFAQNLNQLLTNFLIQKRVSPALFSFAKQLEGALYPKRFDAKTRYADEF